MKLLIALMVLGIAAPTKKLRKPAHLPPAAAAELAQKMNNHGMAQMRLSLSVVLLDYEDTKVAADLIANEPDLKPVAGLPERFFELQKELKVRARALAEVAAKQDDQGMAVAYGRVAETCVACHAAYLAKPAK